jgi:hypothetical protein
MSIQAESMGRPESEEPNEIIFSQLKAEAAMLMAPDEAYNSHEWSRIETSLGPRFRSHERIYRNMSAQELHVRPGVEDELVIEIINRAYGEADVRQRTHLISLGKDMKNSTHLISTQEYDYSFGQQYIAGATEVETGLMDRHEVSELRDLLDSVAHPHDRKPRLIRRMARRLIHL